MLFKDVRNSRDRGKITTGSFHRHAQPYSIAREDANQTSFWVRRMFIRGQSVGYGRTERRSQTNPWWRRLQIRISTARHFNPSYTRDKSARRPWTIKTISQHLTVHLRISSWIWRAGDYAFRDYRRSPRIPRNVHVPCSRPLVLCDGHSTS